MKIQLQPCCFIFLFLLVSCSSPDNETIPTLIQSSTTKYTLTVNSGEGGKVSTSRGTYEEGTSVTLTATPDPQYIFTGWSNGTTETSITITVNSDLTIEATFSFDCSTIQSESIDWNNLSYNLIDIDAPKNQDGSYIEEYKFMAGNSTSAFVDYNNDGYKDIIFFSSDYEDMRERESGYTGYERKQPIKFYLGSCDGYSVDTNNDSKFLGLVHGRKSLLGDYNNDGDVDVFFIGHGYDKQPFPGEFNKVLLSNGDGTFIENDFVDNVSFFHGGASGDFDNDGDLDVFITEAGRGYSGFYINDGSGNFLFDSSIVNQDDFKELYNAELYDINKDGFLDIISGGHDWSWHTNVYDNTTSIIYGNGISYVDSEIIRLPESTIYGQGIMTDVNFFDINNNGQYEIIISKTGDNKDNSENFYKGWSIQILQLVGNEYQDNTEQFIDVSNNLEETWIVWLSISDKDNDGIIEMYNGTPINFGYHEWELINGVFVKKE